jgi:hypothetical protein
MDLENWKELPLIDLMDLIDTTVDEWKKERKKKEKDSLRKQANEFMCEVETRIKRKVYTRL